jgi:hypothetical protein
MPDRGKKTRGLCRLELSRNARGVGERQSCLGPSRVDCGDRVVLDRLQGQGCLQSSGVPRVGCGDEVVPSHAGLVAEMKLS